MFLNSISNEEQGTNALSIDAGNLASIMSSIRVIEELMRRIQKSLGLPTLPNPCEHFDLMVGAGFAGLLVIMLGRLRFSLDDAKLYCSTIISEVFSEKKRFSSGGSFKVAKLEAAVKRMLESCGVGANEKMIDARAVDRQGCKVMVCVAAEHSMRTGVPVCIRTYTVDMRSVLDCTIVEAVCATFALPGLFKPAMITELGGIKVSYIGLATMNPTAQLLEEATHIFSGGHMSSLMSIGAGQKQLIVTDSERIAQEMAARFVNTPGVYFRFNVEQGMQEIGLTEPENLSKGITHAHKYLELVENEKRISDLAQAFGAKEKTVPIAYLNVAIRIASNTIYRAKECPPPSPLFVGREPQLSSIKRCLVDGSEERHICVLHGLGGAGKTQLALKFAELYQDEYQHVFYVDCTSAQTIEADLKNIALAKDVGDCSSDALAWLARLRENWLVVYNNADDTSINLRSYFPACSHGNILITTRNHRMINLAQGVDAECHVSNMSQKDAEKLLAKAARVTEDVGPAGLALIKELGYFALAIVQAGAYIHTRCCTVADYLDMYSASRGDLLEEYAGLVEKADDYERTAYTTWRVSYARLKPSAKQLYELLAFMYHDQITEDIFRYAVIGIEENEWIIPPTNNESAIQEMTKSALSHFTRPTDGSWDKAAFMRAVDDLQSYSLLTYDRLNRVYSIHPLVHEWTRTIINDGTTTCSCTSLLLASSVTWKDGVEDMVFRQTLLNHIDTLPAGEKMRPRLAHRFGLVYREADRQNDMEILAKVVLEAKIQLHGEGNPKNLESMVDLAHAYVKQARWQEAEVLYLDSVRLSRQVQGDEHSVTMGLINSLATVYSDQGWWQKAEALHQEVLELSKRTEGGEQHSTLQSMESLAITYVRQGRWKEAEPLQWEALEIRKRNQGGNHPDTLRSMGNLAATYSNQGKLQEAEAMQREDLELRKRVQGNEHPDTLTSMSNLATTYIRQRRLLEAEALQQQVLEVIKQVRGHKHPDTLTCMNNLAGTYLRQLRLQEAESMQREVLELRKKVRGSEHPETLTSMNELSLTYMAQKRWQEAEPLQRKMLDLSKQLRGNEHPETLNGMSNLAITYSSQGRWQEAEALQQELVEIRIRVQGSEHRSTLASILRLAITRSALAQIRDAETSMKVAVGVSQPLLEDTYPHQASRLQFPGIPERAVMIATVAVYVMAKLIIFAMDSLYPWPGCYLFFAILFIQSLLISIIDVGFYIWAMLWVREEA